MMNLDKAQVGNILSNPIVDRSAPIGM